MKSRPILFTGPMVRAILDGRKTQTRRLVKPEHLKGSNSPHEILHLLGPQLFNEARKYCPYGAPGDRLWVKETFRLSTSDDCSHYDSCSCKVGVPTYRATCGFDREEGDPPWKPSIFMPRKYSRIILEITSIRVERLKDISEEDAKAEGCVPQFWPSERVQLGKNANYRAGYAQLWDEINGADSWALNPWVWVVEFKKL